MDGEADLTGVPVGDYFVSATKSGYVPPADLSIFRASDEQVKAAVASLTTVRLESAGQSATVSLRLRRGGVISGRIQFADGSPASDVVVSVEASDNTPPPLGQRITPEQQILLSLSGAGQRPIATDDQGRYRIFGLRPGSYVIMATIMLDHGPAHLTMANGISPPDHRRERLFPEMVAVFPPGVFRRQNAMRIEITGDEQITDADITVDPSGLHTLRGKVLVAEDRHAPTSGIVQLREGSDKQPVRFTQIDDDGSFQINYLPPGAYTVVVDATDIEPSDPGNPARPSKTILYKQSSVNITVGDDLTVDDILLFPFKPGEPMHP